MIDVAGSTQSKRVYSFWQPTQLLYLIVAGLVVFSGIFAQAVHGLRADDDNLSLIYTLDKINAPAFADALDNRIIEFVKEIGSDEHAVWRFLARKDYNANYGVVLLARSALDRLIPSNIEFPRRMMLRLTVGLIPIVLVPWIVLIWVLARTDSEPLQLATLSILSWSALASFGNYAPSNAIIYFDVGPFKSVGFILVHLISPVFNIYSYWPRSMLAVLVLAGAVARWQGRDRLGYALLGCTVAVHTSEALAVLLCFLIGDLLLTRLRLRDPIILGILSIAIAYGIWNERMFSMVAPTLGLILAAIFFISVLPAALWVRLDDHQAERIPMGAQVIALLTSFHRQIRQATVIQDVAVILAFLFVGTVAAFVASYLTSEISFANFWGQLPTRFYGALGPTMLAGGAFLLLNRMDRKVYQTCAITLAAVAVVTGSLFIAKNRFPANTILSQLEAYESALQNGIKLNPSGLLDERLAYYELSRAMTTHEDPLIRLRETVHRP